MRGLISSSTAALPRAALWNTAVVHARPFWFAGPQDTREHEKKQPQRPSGAHSVAIFCTSCSLARADINVRCCCVVYQFIETRCARFYVYCCGSKKVCLSNKMQFYKVVFCRVRTNRTRGIYPGYNPTKNFCKFCRPFVPVPGTSGDSVRHSYLYTELLEVLYARATIPRVRVQHVLYPLGTSVSSVRSSYPYPEIL